MIFFSEHSLKSHPLLVTLYKYMNNLKYCKVRINEAVKISPTRRILEPSPEHLTAQKSKHFLQNKE